MQYKSATQQQPYACTAAGNKKIVMKKKHLKVLFVIVCFQFLHCDSVHAQPSDQNNLQTADSLYYSQNWTAAYDLYQKLLSDTSHNSFAWNRFGFSSLNLGNYDKALKSFEKALQLNPPPPVKASVYSRMAMVFAIKNQKDEAMTAIDSAYNAGYINIAELDSAKAFAGIRNDAAFIALRNKIYATAYPCMVNAHAREFDFWAGEWNVYATGTTQLVGHSLVQIISGGCALLENWDSPVSTGKSINFIDPNTNKWKQSWAGSYANGVQEFTNGVYKDSAMHFEFETKNPQGKRVIGRFIFYNLGANKVRQFSESSADDGKTWTTNYDFTYIRK